MRAIWSHIQSGIVVALLSTILAACAVGPDFETPAAPKTKSYTKQPLVKQTASAPGIGSSGKAQHFAAGKDIPGEWWMLFHCEELNDLIRTGLANNQTLAAAQATLRQAQETLAAQIGSAYYPNVTAALGVTRERQAGATFGQEITSSTFNLYNAAANVSYTLDVFGGLRRQTETLAAQVENQRYLLEAAHITLTANIVTTAVTVASLEAQIQATHELIHALEQQLTIIDKQYKLGGVSGVDVLTQQNQVAQTRATLPPLEKSLAQSRHALAVLIGVLPSESNLPKISLDRLNLPAKLPISLPSLLVRQRPDVRASEALLHAASAQIGVATANLFPQFPLSASYGRDSNTPQTLFNFSNSAWSLGAQLTQPLFDGGSLRAQRREAIAAFDVTYAQYRQIVLQGFQNVADSLRAIEADARALKTQRQAEIALRDTLKIAEQQVRLGGISYLSLLDTQRQYQQAVINRIKAQAARYTDTAALFLSLGGGWWNRPVDLTLLTVDRSDDAPSKTN